LSCGSTFWSWRSTFFETGQIVGYMKFGWHTHTYIYIYVHIYTHIYITKYNGGYVPRFIFMDMFRSLDTWRYELEQ
jgi:hypothetical protein